MLFAMWVRAAPIAIALSCAPQQPAAPAPTLTVPSAANEASEAPPNDGSAALAGELDESFGEGGVGLFEHAPGEQRFSAMVVLPDGSIAATGYAPFDGMHDIVAARIAPDGRLDQSFGARGFVRVGDRRGFGQAIAADRAGRLLVAGYFHTRGGTDHLVARLDRAGKLDESFGNGGVVIGNFGRSGAPCAVLPRSDGSFVVVGRGAFAYRPDGTLDPRFGDGGKAAFAVTGKSAGAFSTRAVLAPDGGVVAGGYHAQAGRGFVARLSKTGDPDVLFGSAGTVMLAEPPVSSAWAIAVDSENRVLLGLQTGDRRAAVVRLLRDGTHDPSFGSGGIAIVDPAGDDQLYALLHDANDRIVGVGFRGLAEDAQALVTRLSTRGAVDRSFGDRGVVIRRVANGGTFQFAAGWDASGRLVTAGDVWNGNQSRALLMRYR